MRQWSSALLPGDSDCVDWGVYSTADHYHPGPTCLHLATRLNFIHSINSTSFRLFFLFLKWSNIWRFYPWKCWTKQIKTLQRSCYNDNLLYLQASNYSIKKKTEMCLLQMVSALIQACCCGFFFYSLTPLIFLFFLVGPQCEPTSGQQHSFYRRNETNRLYLPFQPRHRKIIIHKVQQ